MYFQKQIMLIIRNNNTFEFKIHFINDTFQWFNTSYAYIEHKLWWQIIFSDN
jgi:hypothetical protein